jgi:hypothetical protein
MYKYIAGIAGSGDRETFSSLSPFTIAGIKVSNTRPLIDKFSTGLRATGPIAIPTPIQSSSYVQAAVTD